MTLAEYAAFVASTNTTESGVRGGLDYAVQKLCAEAGEVAQLRAREHLAGDAPGPLAGGGSVERRARYALELGDIAWYLAEACDLLGLTLEDVLALNQMKLERRRQRSGSACRTAGHGKDPEGEQALAEAYLNPKLPEDGEGWKWRGRVWLVSRCRGDYCSLDGTGTYNRRHMVSEGWVLATPAPAPEYGQCGGCGDTTRHFDRHGMVRCVPCGGS